MVVVTVVGETKRKGEEDGSVERKGMAVLRSGGGGGGKAARW